MYVGDYLARREIYSPDRVAIVDTGKDPVWRLTYRQMNGRANQLARWMREAGIEKGDRVAILARDGVEHLDCFFACSKIGAIHTALNWRLHWRELERIAKTTKPGILMYSGDFTDDVGRLRSATDGEDHAIRHYLHIDGDGVPSSLHYESVLAEAPNLPITCESIDKEDIAALIFTGGTTGFPKAAEVSHRMIGWNTLNTVIHDITHDDVYLNVFPMFHTGGLFVYTLPQIIFGGTTILVRQFDADLVLSIMEREEVTVFAGVPTMYQLLTQAEKWHEADLSSLRFCTSGGAPLPAALVRTYTEEKGVRFKQGFGMTEFGPGIFALAPEDAIRKAGSIGRPNFYVDARVVDDGNEPVGPHTVGELVLKGPSMCSGYYGDVEATAAMLDEKGWFHTGDLAEHDDEWYFFIVGRKKDMFISGGENVYPPEIESALYEHPAVHMCAVIGVPDPRWGEVGLAFVVLEPDAEATEPQLLEFLRARLAGFKVPKEVRFIDEMPVSGAGKIEKQALRRQFRE